MIFLWFQAKLQLFQDYRALFALLIAQAIETFFWQLFNLKKACSISFAILRYFENRKKACTYADRAIEIKQRYKHGC